MKPRTKTQIEAAKVNSTLSEDISILDRDRIIKEIEKNPFCKNRDSVTWFTIREYGYPDWTIDRLYQMHTFHNKTGIKYLCLEILRNFKKEGKNLIFGKLLSMNDYIIYDSAIVLRGNKKDYNGSCFSDLLQATAYEFEGQSGKRVKCITTNPDKLNKVLSIPYGETLYNQGETNLIGFLEQFNYKKEFLSSIRIAKKHGFVFTEKNSYEWFDMVYAIIKLKKDNHNPKFVAPTNLTEMHNYFIKKLRIYQQKKERIAEERAMAKQEKEQLERLESERKINEDYIKCRRRFFDLVISDDQFDLHVLRDVKEFFEEGKEMHHCIFACGYYKKPDSLILSCRNKQGIRVETIEVNLKSFKVTQCYGKYDQFTKWHEHIIRLVNHNMNKIRMCYHNRYKASKVESNVLQAV